MVISLPAYLAILAVLSAERIAEMVLSARNARWARTQGASEAGAGHFPVMAVFHALFIMSSAGEALIAKRPFPGVVGWIALCGAAGSQTLRYWAVATLGRRWNTRIIVLPGTAPVTDGPYRFMRHPNYLAVVLEMICVPMIRGCWITAIVFSIGNAALLSVRIRAEERALGQTYRDQFSSVPRLLPKWHRLPACGVRQK